jgi:hypothetical protein
MHKIEKILFKDERLEELEELSCMLAAPRGFSKFF